MHCKSHWLGVISLNFLKVWIEKITTETMPENSQILLCGTGILEDNGWNHSLQASILASSMNLKRIMIQILHSLLNFIQGFLSKWNTSSYNWLVRWQSSSFRSSSSPCRSSGNHSKSPFQKTIADFDCQNNGSSRCGQWPAHLQTKYYHSGYWRRFMFKRFSS